MKHDPRDILIEPAQLVYAKLLVWLVRVGFVVMFTLFALYATGWVTATVPITEIPLLWDQDAATYANAVGISTGWEWISSLRDAGTLAFAGAIFFPVAATLAALSAAILFARQRATAYALIALAESLILVVAATGLLVRA